MLSTLADYSHLSFTCLLIADIKSVSFVIYQIFSILLAISDNSLRYSVIQTLPELFEWQLEALQSVYGCKAV